MRAQAEEDRDVRQAIEKQVVDGLEYVRLKEQIAVTKDRVNKILYDSDDSAEPQEPTENKASAINNDTTEDDSQKAYEKYLKDKSYVRNIIR